jgi:hypothetical protein
MARHAEALGEVGGRQGAVRLARQLEGGVGAETGGGLQLHDNPCRAEGRARHHALRPKKDRIRWSAIDQRARATPSSEARDQRQRMAADAALAPGIDLDGEHPAAAGWPNSQARTSPAMKPASAPLRRPQEIPLGRQHLSHQ